MYRIKSFLDDKFPRINEIIKQYNGLQNDTINLIASSCYPFVEVLDAMCYPLTTFPTEGFPGQRYFPSYSFMDSIEIYGEELIRSLFTTGNDYKVNIQPHSGTQANQIVYNAILNTDDVVLSLSPSNGGHISHTIVNGKVNRVVHYGLNQKLEINVLEIEKLLKKYRPKLTVLGASSYSKEINIVKISKLAKEYGSYVLADISHTALYIAGKIHTNIFPFVDFATFTLEKNLRGPHGGILIYNKKFEKKVKYSTFPVTQGGPVQAILLSKVVCLSKWNQMDIQKYAKSVVQNAQLLCRFLIEMGFELIWNVPDTHIILINLKGSKFTGVEAERILEKAKILVNRNMIPGDDKKPLVTSGVRLGTATITNLGYSKEDVKILAQAINNGINRFGMKEVNYLIAKYHNKINISSEGKDLEAI